MHLGRHTDGRRRLEGGSEKTWVCSTFRSVMQHCNLNSFVYDVDFVVDMNAQTNEIVKCGDNSGDFMRWKGSQDQSHETARPPISHLFHEVRIGLHA